jgi:hypothetical protein
MKSEAVTRSDPVRSHNPANSGNDQSMDHLQITIMVFKKIDAKLAPSKTDLSHTLPKKLI